MHSSESTRGAAVTAIEDEHSYENTQFTRLDMQGQQFSGVDFTGCDFDHCLLSECRFSHCTFTACRFRACDLSLATVHGSRFTDVRFEESKLVGIDWTKAGEAVISKLFLSIDFDACLLSYASFFGLA